MASVPSSSPVIIAPVINSIEAVSQILSQISNLSHTTLTALSGIQPSSLSKVATPIHPSTDKENNIDDQTISKKSDAIGQQTLAKPTKSIQPTKKPLKKTNQPNPSSNIKSTSKKAHAIIAKTKIDKEKGSAIISHSSSAAEVNSQIQAQTTTKIVKKSRPRWKSAENEEFVKNVIKKIHQLKGRVSNLKCPVSFFEKFPNQKTRKPKTLHNHWNRIIESHRDLIEKYSKIEENDHSSLTTSEQEEDQELETNEESLIPSSSTTVSGINRKRNSTASSAAEDIVTKKSRSLDSNQVTADDSYSLPKPIFQEENLQVSTDATTISNVNVSDVIDLPPLNLDITSDPTFPTLSTGIELVPVVESPDVSRLASNNFIFQQIHSITTIDARQPLHMHTTSYPLLSVSSEVYEMPNVSQQATITTRDASTLVDRPSNTSVPSYNSTVTTQTQSRRIIRTAPQKNNPWTQEELDILVEWIISKINKNNLNIRDIKANFFKDITSDINHRGRDHDKPADYKNIHKKWEKILTHPDFFNRYDENTGKIHERDNLPNLILRKRSITKRVSTKKVFVPSPEEVRLKKIRSVVHSISQNPDLEKRREENLERLRHGYTYSDLQDSNWTEEQDLHLIQKNPYVFSKDGEIRRGRAANSKKTEAVLKV